MEPGNLQRLCGTPGARSGQARPQSKDSCLSYDDFSLGLTVRGCGGAGGCWFYTLRFVDRETAGAGPNQMDITVWRNVSLRRAVCEQAPLAQVIDTNPRTALHSQNLQHVGKSSENMCACRRIVLGYAF
jgi:hypothetical protein